MSLTVKDLVVMAGKTRLLGPLDVTVEPGEPLSILGETGAGKSLLAQAVMGTLPAGLSATGRITLGDTRLDELPTRQREALWGRHVAILPQEPWRALDPLMRSNEQVAESHAVVAGRAWDEARERAAISTTISTGDPANCPAVSASGWRSPARSRPARSCCWPTSPPRASTMPGVTTWCASCAMWRRKAAFFSALPMTSPSHARSAGG